MRHEDPAQRSQASGILATPILLRRGIRELQPTHRLSITLHMLSLPAVGIGRSARLIDAASKVQAIGARPVNRTDPFVCIRVHHLPSSALDSFLPYRSTTPQIGRILGAIAASQAAIGACTIGRNHCAEALPADEQAVRMAAMRRGLRQIATRLRCERPHRTKRNVESAWIMRSHNGLAPHRPERPLGRQRHREARNRSDDRPRKKGRGKGMSVGIDHGRMLRKRHWSADGQNP